MIFHSDRVVVRTAGRGTYEVTDHARDAVQAAGIRDGLCHLFVHHTSASLIITENTDPDVRLDLETWIAEAVRDGDPRFRHRDEGIDDMSAHVRSVLTATTLTIPVHDGQLDLGTWQGVYLWEHRAGPHGRRITASVVGVQ